MRQRKTDIEKDRQTATERDRADHTQRAQTVHQETSHIRLSKTKRRDSVKQALSGGAGNIVGKTKRAPFRHNALFYVVSVRSAEVSNAY